MHHRCNHGQPVNFVQALYIIWVVSHQTKKYLNNCNNENCFFNKQKNQQQQRIKSNELRWSACETTTRQTKNVLNYCAFNFQYMVLIHSSHWRKKKHMHTRYIRWVWVCNGEWLHRPNSWLLTLSKTYRSVQRYSNRMEFGGTMMLRLPYDQR